MGGKNVLIHVGTRVGLEVGIVLIVTCPQKSGSFSGQKSNCGSGCEAQQFMKSAECVIW